MHAYILNETHACIYVVRLMRLFRAGLAELYTENSLLTYEGTQFRGAAAILQKLQQLPAVVNHQLVTCDCQPTPNGGVLIIVCGQQLGFRV